MFCLGVSPGFGPNKRNKPRSGDRNIASTSAADAPDYFYEASSEFLFTVMDLAEMGLELRYRLIGFLNRKDRKDR